MGACCVLGICCPPEVRRQKFIAHYMDLGFDREQSELLSDDSIAQIDHLMSHGLGELMREARDHGHKG